jgi:hypothetical protein
MNKAKQQVLSVLAVGLFGALALGSGESKPKVDLKTAAADGPSAAELAPIFELGGKATDLQREEKEKAIKGKVVDWKGLKVYEVGKSGDKCFKIQTSTAANAPGTFTKVCPDDETMRAKIAALKTDDLINVRGVIEGVSMRNINLDPAMVIDEAEARAAAATAAAKGASPEVKKFLEKLSGAWEDVDPDAFKPGLKAAGMICKREFKVDAGGTSGSMQSTIYCREMVADGRTRLNWTLDSTNDKGFRIQVKGPSGTEVLGALEFEIDGDMLVEATGPGERRKFKRL